VQKLLAAAGLGSRRAIEQWIREGRVTVNGQVVQLGARAGPGDDVRVDGRPVRLAPAHAPARRLLIYHKPLGQVTTRSDPQGRPTVFDGLPEPGTGRWIVVGRLDIGTSGLLLFTTDGELAHRLMHPSSEIEREDLVTVRGHPSPATLQRLRTGVMLEDGPARFDRLRPVSRTAADATFRVVLHEGRNREVRRMWEAFGHEVTRLKRVRFGPVELPRDLPPGAHREVPVEVMDELLRGLQARQ